VEFVKGAIIAKIFKEKDFGFAAMRSKFHIDSFGQKF
jgi:hypothetical protein